MQTSRTWWCERAKIKKLIKSNKFSWSYAYFIPQKMKVKEANIRQSASKVFKGFPGDFFSLERISVYLKNLVFTNVIIFSILEHQSKYFNS